MSSATYGSSMSAFPSGFTTGGGSNNAGGPSAFIHKRWISSTGQEHGVTTRPALKTLTLSGSSTPILPAPAKIPKKPPPVELMGPK